MAIRLKPKFFGPLTLQTREPGSFSYTTNQGYTASTGSSASSESATPSDLIMASLASCIAISLEMAAQKMKIETGRIAVEIDAAKALDLPSRFGRFNAIVQLEKVEDDALANKLIKQAKEMCTVSHTLNAEVEISLDGGTNP
jgi:uncharacterized OsmC-like protein